MDNILLKPTRVFEQFDKINQIPRKSKNIEDNIKEEKKEEKKIEQKAEKKEEKKVEIKKEKKIEKKEIKIEEKKEEEKAEKVVIPILRRSKTEKVRSFSLRMNRGLLKKPRVKLEK